MRHYLHARRISLLHQITTKHRGRPTQYSFQTSPSQSVHTHPATDLPLKNKSLLAFLASTKKSQPLPPGSSPAPHIESLSAEPSTSQTLLPQSPLTDPSLTAARLRHTTRKPRPSSSISSSSSSSFDLNSPTTTTTTTDSATDISASFQLKLQQNPFAHALATPVRQCCLTGARLPAEYLLAFGLAPHPQTGKMWHLPRVAAARDHGVGNRGEDVRGSLVVGGQGKNVNGREENQKEEEEEEVVVGKVDHDGEREIERREEGKGGVRQDSTAAAPTDTRTGIGNGESIESTNNGGGEDRALHQQQQQQPPPPQRGGRGAPASAGGGQSRSLSSTYYLSSARALRIVRTKSPRNYNMMTSHRWKEDKAFDMKQVVWREDMDGFVKGLLRRKVVNDLVRLAGRGKGKRKERRNQAAAVMVCEEGWEGVEKMDGVSGVLWFGDGLEEGWNGVDGQERVIEGSGEKAEASLLTEDTARQVAQMLKTADGPLPYAMLRLPTPNTCIPVYNLPKMLGEQYTKQLREGTAGTYGGSLTVVRSKDAIATKVQRDLWRLVGYLSKEGKWASEDGQRNKCDA